MAKATKKKVDGKKTAKRTRSEVNKENGKATQFQPGNTFGKGRPKGLLNLSTRLEIGLNALAIEFAEKHNEKYAGQIKSKKMEAMTEEDVDIMGDIFRQYINLARNGNLKAIDSLMDRAYGKATAKVELSGDPDHPIRHEHEMAEVDAEVESWIDGWFNPKKKTKVSVKKKAHGDSKTDTGADD